MNKKLIGTLLSACLMILVGFFLLGDFEEEVDPTVTPSRTRAQAVATITEAVAKAATAIEITPASTRAATATAAGTRQATPPGAGGPSPTPARSASPRATQPTLKTAGTSAPVELTPAASLTRFRVGVSTPFGLQVDPNAWEAFAIPTPTGVAYGLTYKKLPTCRLLDEAGRDTPQGWTHNNVIKSLGGRTYTLENWIDPGSSRVALVIFALDARIRIELDNPAGSSECIQAAENVIAASTPALLTP